MIDFHTHIYPDKIAASTVEMLSTEGRFFPALDGRAESLKNSIKERNIDLAVILPVATNPKPEKVRHLNEYALQFDGTDGLLSLGGIHPDCPQWKEELHRIKADGMKGIKIHPAYQKVALDDIRFLRIIEEAASLGLFVISHMGLDVGLPGIKLCTPQMAAHVVEEVGKFPFILAHMGGWMDWKSVEEYIPGTGCYLDTSFSLDRVRINAQAPVSEKMPDYMLGKEYEFLNSEDFRRMVKKIGEDHILFGSDSPWDDPMREIEWIKSLGLGEEIEEKIFDRNARELLNL